MTTHVSKTAVLTLVFQFTLFACGALWAVEPRTEHTWQLEEGETPAPSSLEDAAWLAGAWKGEEALADAHMDKALAESFFEILCERTDIDAEAFKKKHGGTASTGHGRKRKGAEE